MEIQFSIVSWHPQLATDQIGTRDTNLLAMLGLGEESTTEELEHMTQQG